VEQTPTPAPNPTPAETPAQTPALAPTHPSGKMTGRTKAALWLMIAPTGLFIATFILYAITNFITTATAPEPEAGQLFSSGGGGIVIVNVLLFLTGVVSFLTWLPGLIIGIVLLATKK